MSLEVSLADMCQGLGSVNPIGLRQCRLEDGLALGIFPLTIVQVQPQGCNCCYLPQIWLTNTAVTVTYMPPSIFTQMVSGTTRPYQTNRESLTQIPLSRRVL